MLHATCFAVLPTKGMLLHGSRLLLLRLGPSCLTIDTSFRLFVCLRLRTQILLQSAVEAVVQEKYPHGNVDVLIPRSPDLAIVQGASHFVRLESSRPTPPNVGLGWRQGAPGFTKITSPTSYGILSGEVRCVLVLSTPVIGRTLFASKECTTACACRT